MSIAADLTGKTALVTGASSEGFGRFFAEVLSKAGADVTVSARRRSRLDEVIAAIERTGGRVRGDNYDGRLSGNYDGR
jgi:NAD(P)-dependent dehydrogenase (short-subunit alcohol dehydrogenase family)